MFDSLAFEPIVLISRPISCAMKPSLRPAPSFLGGHLAEIPAVVGQAYLLFGDIEFFEVEDHLLLQPVAVDVYLQLFEVFQQAGPDRLRAGLFEGTTSCL